LSQFRPIYLNDSRIIITCTPTPTLCNSTITMKHFSSIIPINQLAVSPCSCILSQGDFFPYCLLSVCIGNNFDAIKTRKIPATQHIYSQIDTNDMIQYVTRPFVSSCYHRESRVSPTLRSHTTAISIRVRRCTPHRHCTTYRNPAWV